MTKFTWRHLSLIFGNQFKLTAAEAATILTGHIFHHKWKHGKDKKIGMMWRDEMVVGAFTNVLAEEEEIAKRIGRKKALRKLFNDGVSWRQFTILAGLKYKNSSEGFRTFRNDYGAWKRLKFFKNVWKKGKRTSKKFEKRIKARVYAAEKILKAENKSVLTGQERMKKLIESGEMERTPSGFRKIPK